MRDQKPICGPALRSLLSMLCLLSASPAFGQFSVAQIKAFCAESQLGAKPFARLIQGSDGALYGTTVLASGELAGTVFKLNKDGTGYSVLHVFGQSGDDADGATPFSELLEGSDDSLYGTTHLGGNANEGTVFRLQKDGSGYRVLHSFAGPGEDGASPFSSVIEGSDGMLYGTTHYGGSDDLGTIYKLNKDGTGFSLLHSFSTNNADGVQPFAGLLEASDGVLYGTTAFGGANNQGTIFKLNRDGSDYQVLQSLTGRNGDGASPYGALLEGSDGELYGTTLAGGSAKKGTIFKLNRDRRIYSVLHSFTATGNEGSEPYGGLIWGGDGALYGTTAFGGSSDQGTVFKLNRNGGDFRVLFSFKGAAAGGTPRSALIEGSDGTFFGVTDSGGSANRGTVFELSKDGSSHGVLHSFEGGGDIVNPFARLLAGTDGALYGTSWGGGIADSGTVFKINRDGGSLSVLHSFAGTDGDGANPHAGLLEGSDGAMYGTTVVGGTTNFGTVFKLNKDGTGYRILRKFTGAPGDGVQPYGGLLETANGMLYGTTAFGGSAGRGTIFMLNKDGTGYSVLRSFALMPDATGPYSGLISGSDGFLYGTTPHGGSFNFGTVFKLKADGTGYSLLRSFTGTDGDGKHAFARITEGSDGALYGTTALGGKTNQGTLFTLNKDGSGYRVVHEFNGLDGDGALPSANANLAVGGDGVLYGTTYSGGFADAGTIFQLDANAGGYRVIYQFTGAEEDGANPYAGLIKAGDGALYGTTLNAGLTCGTVFRLAPKASLLIGAGEHLTLKGPPAYRFAIQFREDLGSPRPWQFLTNVTLVTDQLTFLIPPASTHQRRFYRAELVP